MITIDLQERLSWLHENSVQVSDKFIAIEEKMRDCVFLLECKLENYCIHFKKIEDMKISYFKEQKCADAIVFERLPDENWVLHIIEFKTTVTPDKWEQIKKQFCGAVQSSLACMGILGISNVKNIKCYTAYQKETLLTNPTLLKVRNGVRQTSTDWMTNNIHLDLIGKRVEHNRIYLDDNGNAMITLH